MNVARKNVLIAPSSTGVTDTFLTPPGKLLERRRVQESGPKRTRPSKDARPRELRFEALQIPRRDLAFLGTANVPVSRHHPDLVSLRRPTPRRTAFTSGIRGNQPLPVAAFTVTCVSESPSTHEVVRELDGCKSDVS